MLLSIAALALALIVIAVAVRAERRRDAQAAAMADFAVQQGWHALEQPPAALAEFLPVYLTVLAKVGSVRPGETFTHSEASFSNAYAAELQGLKMVLLQYDLTEYYVEENPLSGSEREAATTTNFVVAYAGVAMNLTDVVLVHHSLLNRLSSFGEYKDMQKLELEGDFNDQFDTYILPDTQDDALELLTPDTMALIEDLASGASLEFGEKAVVASLQGQAMTPAVAQPLVTNLAALVANVTAKHDTEAP